MTSVMLSQSCHEWALIPPMVSKLRTTCTGASTPVETRNWGKRCYSGYMLGIQPGKYFTWSSSARVAD